MASGGGRRGKAALRKPGGSKGRARASHSRGASAMPSIGFSKGQAVRKRAARRLQRLK